MNKRFVCLIFAFLFLRALPLGAEEISYDRYAPLWPDGPLKEPPSRSAEFFKDFGTHFLAYPLELVRRPLDKGLIFVERNHLDDKVQWIYEKMKNHGFTPKLYSLYGSDGLCGGFEIEFVKLANLKDQFPHTTVEGSALWTVGQISDYQVKFLQSQIAGRGIQLGGNFRYEDRREEDFYGIGPNTSLGDGTSYRMERTTLEAMSGFQFLNTWLARGKFIYQNVNIGDGDDGKMGIIDDIFVQKRGQSIPGLQGDQMVRWAWEIEHDNRDNEDLPTVGGYQRFHFSFNKGMANDAGFFRYRAEAAQFFKVFSEKRIFGIRGVMEHNDEIGGRSVPFFDRVRLGGIGVYPRVGDVHRGYRRDRFYDESLLLFNAEYRWPILEYREIRAEPVIFCVMGQVFGEWSRFQTKDFSFSYGLGFRISAEKKVVTEIDLARSNEGTQFYVKTRAPF